MSSTVKEHGKCFKDFGHVFTVLWWSFQGTTGFNFFSSDLCEKDFKVGLYFMGHLVFMITFTIQNVNSINFEAVWVFYTGISNLILSQWYNSLFLYCCFDFCSSSNWIHDTIYSLVFRRRYRSLYLHEYVFETVSGIVDLIADLVELSWLQVEWYCRSLARF